MPYDSMPEPKHHDFTGARFTETERRQRQRKRLNRWIAEARKADKRPLTDTAALYARWIAERDGVEIPAEARSHCQLAPVLDDDGITRNRVYRVVFETGGTPSRGYYSETTYRDSDVVATIDIPNWDFVARVVEFVEI